MINTLKRGAPLGHRHIHGGDAGIFASADRCATQRHPIRMPLRLHGALLQHPAGRRSVAAMPAEKHVEPVVGLPERGARGRSAGCAQGRDRAGCGAEDRICSARRSSGQAGGNRGSQSGGKHAAKKPSDAQVAAIRSACRSDYQKVCAGVPTGGAAGAAMPGKEQVESLGALPAGRQRSQRRRSARRAAAAAAAAAAPAAPAAAAPTVLVLRPMRPREELFVLRSACGGDVRALCGGVAPGGGRIVQCLATQAASLSPACKEVLAQFAAQ